MMCAASVWSVFKNFRRAGTELKSCATSMRVPAGAPVSSTAATRPPSTAMRVADLFFNVPARLKFLKSRPTELGHATEWVVRLGLAHPEVALVLGEQVILEGRGKEVLDEVGHHFSTRTMTHHDSGIVAQRQRTSPAIKVESLIGHSQSSSLVNCHPEPQP